MRVVFAGPALEQANALDDWWRTNHPAAPDLFVQELAAAKRLPASTPEIGPPFVERAGVLVRRILLRRSRNHVYYEIDHAQGIVTVVAVWGAPKGKTPDL